MDVLESDKEFFGSIPKMYDTYMVPLVFEPYAQDLTRRLCARPVSRLLEIAAGTGVVTRAMASLLPETVAIVATDLNQTMLDYAREKATSSRVEWRQADAMQLPFEDATFDSVVCQFGAMFFPEKSQAFSEARRVLKPGGAFVFNVWDRISENEFAETVTNALESFFPNDPLRFMARVPHGYYDQNVIRRDLANAGFASPSIETIATQSRATSAHFAATAFCQGTPLRNEIEARDASRLREATNIASEAIAKRFGSGNIEGKIQALVVTLEV